MNTIDFNNLGMPVFTGRPRGEAARKKLGLDLYDEKPDVVVVKIPDGTYAITSSYFLGLFGPSVRKLGSKHEFTKKYRFEAPSRISTRVDEWIDRALRDKGKI